GGVERAKAAPAPPKPLFDLPGGALGLLLCAIPFGLLVFWSALSWLEKRSTPDVVARINRYTEKAEVATVRARQEDRGSTARRLAGPLMAIGDKVMGRSKFFERSRVRAEQAAIAIRPRELFALMVVFAGLGAFFALMVGITFLFVVLPLFFGFLPNFWLRMKARKRRNTFDDQLPDILQGIASSLKAGHSFNQAINAMIKDAPQPTSEEFSRVMTEARLGMPIEMALQHMADRMGSADFDFAVTTVNIQRSVGGSLAEILEMVGDTVRNRQQFRKKVKALVSMGQASAYVLLAMPIVLGLVLTLMNPAFMEPLYTTSMGHMMMAAGAVSMTFGYFACMKIVNVQS
ncbi:MAG: putative type secretion system integral rane subunit, partial [Thermoleophilia bacterium]|nr:putative type secretion system integral rane subunit [Thermoleophilia bacterium]